jgi:carboxyl-terminal processing protease
MQPRRWMAIMLAASLALALAAASARADPIVEEAVRIILRYELARPAPTSLDQDSSAALLASLRRIDPAAQWRPPDEAAAIRRWTGEEILGIGASVIDDGTRILLVPFAGGALARQGITRPVRLLALAGQPVERLGLDTVQQMLGEPKRDRIEATVQDLTGGPPLRLVLARGPYDALSAERIEIRSFPFLRIHRFVKGLTLDQFRRALQPVLAAGQPIVIDLRYSTGGDLFEALDIASLFLPPGLKLATLEDAAGRRIVLTSVGGGHVGAGRLTLLVGRGTMSASEVFAAALGAYGRARLVGTPTFGKCTAQTGFPLTDGSELVLSTGRILTASDWYCDGRGLTPDIRLEQAEADDTDALMARYAR